MIQEEVRAARPGGVLLTAAHKLHWVALMLLLTRATLLHDQSPFAIALAAAGFSAGVPAWALILGLLLGLNPALGWMALTPVVGTAIALALTRLLNAFPEKYRGRPGKNGMIGGRDAVVALTAGVSTIIPAMAVSQGIAYNMMMASANSVIAACVAPILLSAVALRPDREHLMRDEQLAVAMIAAMALMGAWSLPVIGTALAPFLAALLCLIGASLGAGQGAAAGLLMGAALSFAGNDRFIGAALGLCALTAGAAAPLGRWAAALTFALCNTVTLIYGLGGNYGALHPLQAFAAGLVYCLMPPFFLQKIGAWFAPAADSHDPERLAARLMGDARRRLRALGGVFGELASGYDAPFDAPSERALIAKMRAQLCRGCPNLEACWGGTDSRASRLMCGLIAKAAAGETLSEKDELPPALSRLCRRAGHIPLRLGPMLNDFAKKRRSASARGQASALIGKQFRQAEALLASASGTLSAPVRMDGALSAQARAALDREAIRALDVLALRSELAGTLTITAVKRDGVWMEEEAKRAAERLSIELGIPMRPASVGALSGELSFFQAPRFTATVGYVGRAKSESAPSGDSHLAAGLNGGRVIMMLSDGMGSGEQALRESRATVRMIRRFLAADVERTLTFESVNQLLMLLGGEEMFATCDLCVLDLNNCTASFSKLGACDSYLLRRGTLTKIQGGRLPLGILEGVTPASATLKLRPGDMIVMMTDGLFDASIDEERLWIEKAIPELRNESPQALCEQLLRQALARQQEARDDITVLAARIGKA